MSSEAARSAILQLFQSAFAAKEPAVPVFYENLEFEQPKTLPWVYVTIVDNDMKRANIGNSLQVKMYGVVNCQVSVPNGYGTKRLREIADSIGEILFDRQIAIAGGSLTFTNVTKQLPRQIASWYSVSVQCEFHARFTLVR